MPFVAQVPWVDPTYAEAFEEGQIRGYDHANYVITYGGDLDKVADSPGWVTGNLLHPYANGWKAGVAQYLEEQEK